jgi:hypothetical protein
MSQVTISATPIVSSEPILMMVLPSGNLREIVIKRRRSLNPMYDYVNTWKDTKGFGLCLAVQPAGPPKPGWYNSPSAGLKGNPGYDPLM